MEVKIDKTIQSADIVKKKGTNTEVESCVFFGEGYFCKTQAEAREAAELLKSFFEAKQSGKDVVLVIDNATPASLAWQDGYAEGKREGYAEGRNHGINEVTTDFFINSQTSKPKGEPDPLIIARNAALIFAHNAHDFDERRAVESAAKIIELSCNHEK